MKKNGRQLIAFILAFFTQFCFGVAHAEGGVAVSGALEPVPAAHSPIATQASMLGAAKAGKRIVAVGDRGTILLSDDLGRHYRQAKSVPVSSLLTDVFFVDERVGWAVGHWGVILKTTDGGETWLIQRVKADEDRPLFGVHFFDADHGVAVGLWSLVLLTDDGGKNWSVQGVPAPPDSKGSSKTGGLNLLSLFAGSGGHIYATSERGYVLSSADRGHSWKYSSTGYSGSLWGGVELPGGKVMVVGQRGTVLSGSAQDGGWVRIPVNSKSSLTSVTSSNGQIILAGLDGFLAFSSDAGRTFKPIQAPDAPSYTSSLPISEGRWALFSRRGILPPFSAPGV